LTKITIYYKKEKIEIKLSHEKLQNVFVKIKNNVYLFSNQVKIKIIIK